MKRLLVFGVLAFSCGIAANAEEVLLIPDIAPISDAAIRAPLVVEKIKKGELTAEEAWQKGELNEETLLFLLNQEGGDKGSLNLVDKANLSDELVEVLIKQCSRLIEMPNNLAEGVTYRLGDYYFRKGDSKAISLFEKLLSKADNQRMQNKQGTLLPWFYEMTAVRLSEYYSACGTPEKALKMARHALPFTKNPVYKAHFLWMAGRATKELGDDNSAKQFFAQAANSKDSFFSGLAIHDQGAALIKAGRYQQAVDVLRTGLEFPFEGDAKRVEVALLSRLSQAYLKMGEALLALQCAERALEKERTVPKDNSSRLDLNIIMLQSKEVHHLSQKALKQPLSCDVSSVQLSRKNKEKSHAVIPVRWINPTPIKCSVNNPGVAIIDNGPLLWQGLCVGREFLLEMRESNNKDSFAAEVSISAAKSEKPLTIAVQVFE